MANASIKEAFDSTLKEAFAGIKLMIWAIPITMGLCSIYMGGFLGTVGGTILTAISAFLFFGLCVTSAHNVIIKKDTIIPSVNFIEMLINGVMAFVAVAPFSIVTYLLSLCITIPFANYGEQLMEHPVLTFTAIELIGFLIASIPITALAMFVRRLNILEVFNLKKFFYAMGEVFLAYTTYTFRFVFFALLIFGFIVYLFYLFIGFENSFWVYLVVLISITYFLFLFNAIAQISDDIFTFIEKDEDKKREEDKIKKLVEEHK